MTDTRKWSAVAAVLVAAILAAGWFLLVSPKRSEAAALRAQTVTQDDANVALQQKLEQLKAQQADLPAQRARLAQIQSNIPDNPALPSFIRDLTTAARKVGVSLDMMSPSTPTAVTAAAPGTVAPAPAAGPALYQVPVTLNVTGSYFELEQFVGKLEGLQRSFLLTSFTLTPKPSEEASDTLSIALSGRVFLSHDAAPAAVTPVVPATSE